MTYERLVTVHACTFPDEAMLLRSRLEAEGIPVFMRNEHATRMYSFRPHMFGGAEIQVPESEAELAREVLAEVLPKLLGKGGHAVGDGAIHEGPAKVPERPVCRSCGETRIGLRAHLQRLLAIPMLFFGIGTSQTPRSITCPRCGTIRDR